MVDSPVLTGAGRSRCSPLLRGLNLASGRALPLRSAREAVSAHRVIWPPMPGLGRRPGQRARPSTRTCPAASGTIGSRTRCSWPPSPASDIHHHGPTMTANDSRRLTPTHARLTDQSVALIVKRCVAAIAQDPRLFAGHSLRAGLARSAAAGGATARDIMQQTRHRGVAMVRG
jgi:hypothetical protein